jgi:Mrp family chromosome partitioning ATPase
MFTACKNGDGVSSIARNLALSLALASLGKVLLVELNPKAQTKKNADAEKPNDLSFLLENVHKFLPQQDTLLLSAVDRAPKNFFSVSAKPGFACSSNLVQSNAFKTLLNHFRAQFEYVILDAPPVFAPSGCLALGALVDGVVFVVLSEHTRQEVAKNARSQLESVGANILGVVINKKKYYIPNFIYRRL